MAQITALYIKDLIKFVGTPEFCPQYSSRPSPMFLSLRNHPKFVFTHGASQILRASFARSARELGE